MSPRHSDEDLKLSFQDLSLASQKAANAISGLGVKKAVCILPKVPEWWIINIGTIRANVTLLPGTTQLQSKDILGRLTASGADCIIADQLVADKVRTFIQSFECLLFQKVIAFTVVTELVNRVSESRLLANGINVK